MAMAKAPLTHTLMVLKFQLVSISAPCLGSSWALKLGRHNLSRARLLPGWRRPRPRCLGSGWPWVPSVREPANEAGDRRAVASGERDGVDTEATVLPSRRPRPLPLRARSRLQREIFLKRVRRFRSRRTRGRRPAGGKARVQVRGASSGSQVFDVNIWPRQPGVIVKPTQQNIMVGMNCDLNWWGG